MVGARLITRMFDLATMLVLARILQPRDFGIVAVAMTLILLTDSATELQLNQALVRLPAISRAQYDTAFTLSVLRGLVISCILLALAYPFSIFYADRRLLPLICALSIAPVARSMFSPRLANFQKQMSFWRDFVMELSGKLVAFSVGLTMALLTQSYWAIVAATIANPIANLVSSYLLAPYRPKLTLSELPVFFAFAGWTSAAQMVSAFNWQFERLLLGRLMLPARIGLFTAASDLATMPFLAFFGPIIRPLLAAFSHLRDEKTRLKASYQGASNAVVAIGLPLLVGESLLSDPIIHTLFGPKWQEAAPLLRWLAISTMPAMLAMPAIPLIMSTGDTNLLFRRNLLETLVKIPIAVIGTLKFGFFGIIAARFFSEVVAGAFCMSVVKRLTGLAMLDQILVSWRTAASAAIMAFVVAFYRHVVFVPTSDLHVVLELILPAMIGAATYAGSLYLLWIWARQPAGIEAMAYGILSPMVGKLRRLTSSFLARARKARPVWSYIRRPG